MRKKLKTYIIYGMWLFFSIMGWFLSPSIFRQLFKRYSWGCLSILFIIFLAMILGFGYLISCTKKKFKQNTPRRTATMSRKRWLFKRGCVDRLNQLYLYRSISIQNMDASLILSFSMKLRRSVFVSSGFVTDRYARRITNRREEKEFGIRFR